MFENKVEPLLPKKDFYIRFLRYVLISSVLLGFSLAIGMIGYHHFCGLGWSDSLLNASMILAGMGPVKNLEHVGDSAKIFASVYAIYSGIAFLAIFAVILAPALHRFMHILHLESN